MASGSVWNQDNIRDVAESVGIASLTTDAVDHLTRDVEFRIAQVLEEALKCMRHAKRTTLFTADISQALRILDVEPLYGYESTRPLKFGEASIGPGQPLYYLEDEEVDFEKLINAPLPKVPREITFTAHWLAVEGVQPTIPQNPAPADGRNADLLPKGPGANPHLAATAGADNLTVKPLVKHVLSKELQLYFEHVCNALLDEGNPEYRAAALASLRDDPGLHQLVPYFVHYVAEKVTHNLKNVFVLGQMMHLIESLLENPHLHIAPYIASLVPPVLTCLVGRRLGPASSSSNANGNFVAHLTNGNGHTSVPNLPPHYALRNLAASLLQSISRPSFSNSTPTLKPRLARSLLKHLLAKMPQPLGTYYGSIRGLSDVAGVEGVRVLLLPNLPALNGILTDMATDDQESETKSLEIKMVVEAAVEALTMIEQDAAGLSNGDEQVTAQDKEQLTDKVGSLIADRIWEIGRSTLVKAVLAADLPA